MKRRSSFIERMVVGRTSEISEAKGVGDEHKRSDEEGNCIGTLLRSVGTGGVALRQRKLDVACLRRCITQFN